ncbi:LuxR family transcriptional regulator [Amylibacter sp. SFDW26]|uniref:helix-turn-helix transcriptional regulator n=1 Tax=Amylibacter sp. SFDW26 TaxID=2652722 RepID=UPI001262857D|nr:LuxR family transcriptional regulator [Amylibacter sp. SFDW26]KAB7610287.1 LuxR family transcriptional regulator [Amylibacter sp. SFDW26]
MLSSIIPNFDNELKSIEEIANKGIVIAWNTGYSGAEYLLSTYSEKWKEEYHSKSLQFVDPTVWWAIRNTGQCRWSETGYIDISRVFKKARRYDINYGAIFSRLKNGKKSILSVSRHDRELTDNEIMLLTAQWDRMTNALIANANLSTGELEVLKMLRDGYNYPEISYALEVSVSGIKKRVAKSMHKLNAKTPTHAVSIAIVRSYLNDG